MAMCEGCALAFLERGSRTACLTMCSNFMSGICFFLSLHTSLLQPALELVVPRGWPPCLAVARIVC